MKSGKLQVSIFLIIFSFFFVNDIFAGSVSKLSNIFTLDTRTEELPPVDGWQILTNKGDTYNEDLIIDNNGKVWCFYFRSPGGNQPIYLKIFKSDGFVYKSEQIIGYSSGYTEHKYNSIRAAENDSTCDVWAAIQGYEGGYFVIFDSTGTVKQDSTVLDKSAFSPKLTNGKNGMMWFSWHTQIEGNSESQGKVAGYSANGEIYSGPNTIGRHTYIFNTDIAVDDSNRIWTVFEVNQNGDYATKYSIFNSDFSSYLDGIIVANNVAPLNPQRQIFSDVINQKMWILEKDTSLAQQNIHLYTLDGSKINTIENIGDCGFVRNESNFLEVLRFNNQNSENKIYETNLYYTQTGNFYSSEIKFDSTFQFVRNGIAYNLDYSSLKAYAVQFDSNSTKIKFEQVTPGVAEISVKPINFDTTKITATYKKQKSVKVQNIGNNILEVYNIVPNDPHFSVSNTAFQVLPGQYRIISVEFVPTNTDSIVDYILFVSNDPANDSLKVTVTGKGYNPTVPIITVDKDSLIFDTIILGNTQTKRIFVYNDDLYEPLKIYSITTNNPQFTTPDSSGFKVNPQKGEWVSVNFKPTTEGIIEGLLTINSNDTTNPGLEILLRGTGIRSGNPVISVSPDTLNFGEVALGHQKSLYLEIENNSDTILEINNISVADTQFTANITNFTIQPFSRYYVLISYNVKRIGEVNTTITINSSDPALPTYLLPVTGTGRAAKPASIAISHDTLNYGLIPINNSKAAYFWISNLGEEPLQIQGIQSNDRRYVVYQNSFTVNPGYPRSVTVIFTPDEPDTINGLLTITSSDATNDTSYLHLTGIGRILSAPTMVLSTERIEFGEVATTQRLTKSFTIHNGGEQLLEVSKIELENPNPSYSISPHSFNVPYGQYRTVYVTFSPQQRGGLAANINITSNDTTNQTIALHGTGRDPLPPNIYVSHNSIQFDSVAVSKSKSQYIWIKNTGETELNVHNISTEDTSFSANINSFKLNPGQYQYVLITFSPAMPFAYQDNLIIKSDDPDNQYKYVGLTGFGRPLRDQHIQLSSNSLSFGEIPTGQQRVMGLTVYNSGERELIISNVSNINAAFLIDNREFIVSPGSYHIMYVTFSPELLITYQDTLKITNNDPNTALVTVPLSGTGRRLKDQKIAVFPDSINFGSIGIGLTSSQNIQLRNDGEVNLAIDSIKINSSYFSVKSDTVFNISPGFSNWLSVSFQPDSIGKFEAVLTICSNDPDTSQYRIPLIGYGRELLAPNITFYPGEMNFGDVAVGRNKNMNLYIGNDGEQELVVTSIVSSDDQFKVDNTTFSVQPGFSQFLTLSFQPTVMDTTIAQLTVISNDPDSGVSIVPVRGIGRALQEPQLVYTPEQVNFGEVTLGDSLSKHISFQNAGDLPLYLANFVSYDSHFVVNNDTVIIEGGQNYNLNVTFFPDDTLEIQSSLEIRTNDPNNYAILIPLKGKGKTLTQHIAVSPPHLDFKDVQIYTTSTRHLWVSNFGEKLLTISNIFSDNINFKPLLTNFTLDQNENKQVPISFTPDSFKTFSGKLTIISNDPVVDSLIILMTGAGRDSLNQEISVSPDSVHFGSVALNNSRTLSISVNNVGEKNLKVYNIISSHSAFAPNLTNFQVAPKSWQTIHVSFTPTFTIHYNDTLKIISNDPKHDTVLVKLAGIGREPVSQKIVVSNTILDFGTVPTDRTKSLSFGISNQGEKNLEISQLAISDSQFSIKEKWLIINPGQTKYLDIIFSPVRTDLVNTNLKINSNDPNNPQINITLRGKGIFYEGPKISIRPNSIYFDNTLIGAMKKLSLWILNSSHKDTLKITSFALNHEAFSLSQSTLTIAPEDSGAVQVVFTPHTVGNHSAKVTIYCNDIYQNTLGFWVYGYGTEENTGQNFLAQLGWKQDGYTPVGNVFSPDPHTDSLLSDGPDRAWFIKDVFLSEEPATATINLCFDDEIQLFVNGTLVLVDTSNQPFHWNISNRNIKPYLRLGRNRISILIWNKADLVGGFDCELIVAGESKIKRGDQNWTHPDATWWYYGEMGKQYPTPPNDTPYDRLWFHSEYGLAGTDTVTANWVFEPTGNDTIYDSSPYGQKAILHNITWIGGVIGQAMQFGGQANSYVELYSNLNRIPQTIELWFNCYEQRQYGQNIITNRGTSQFGQGLFIDPNMRLGVYYYNGEFLTNFIISPNSWYFISTQYKSNQVFVYVNNNLIGSTTYALGNPIGSSICYLGGNPLQQDTTTAFYGAIDELQIKNTATVPSQMQQVARISIIPPDTATKGEDIQLNFDIFPTQFKINSGTFEYAWGGSDAYRIKSLGDRDSTFNSPLQIIIPSDSITVRGLKYRISLQTDYGTVSYPGFDQNEGEYSWIEVATPGETSPVALPEKIHRMISIPYVLNDPSIDGVLVDNLGAENPYNWRLFDWLQDDTNYVAFDDSNWQENRGFEQGTAFWLITSEPQTFDAGSGRSPENVNYRINLEPGWNMIGNPFPYAISWLDIEKTSNFISDPIYRSTTDSIGWIYNVANLNPWDGYFVWNGDSSSRSLIVPPKEAPIRPLMKQQTLAHKYLSKYEDVSILISSDIRCGKFIDVDNLFGVSTTAANEYDRYDLKEAPVIGDYVSLWIDNRKWKKYGGQYTVDIRKAGLDGYSWDIVVDYSIKKPEDFLTITFQQLTDLPENWLIYLFDLSEDISINLRKQSEISLKSIADEQTFKPYKLVIGTEDYVLQNSTDIPLIPLAFELFQNYPNPFNAITTISFNLPKRMYVTVKIYNILGQQVKTLVDEEVRGGHHKIHWDGTNNQGNLLATGLYIVRLHAKDKVAVKKLLLIK